MAYFCLVGQKIEISTRGTNSMPFLVFRMCGRARFQVTTKDSVFAIKVWMFEPKDCVLEMTGAKYHVRIE